MPLECIKTVIDTGGGPTAQGLATFPQFWRTGRSIAAANGAGALFRGLAPNMVRLSLMCVSPLSVVPAKLWFGLDGCGQRRRRPVPGPRAQHGALVVHAYFALSVSRKCSDFLDAVNGVGARC